MVCRRQQFFCDNNSARTCQHDGFIQLGLSIMGGSGGNPYFGTAKHPAVQKDGTGYSVRHLDLSEDDLVSS